MGPARDLMQNAGIGTSVASMRTRSGMDLDTSTELLRAHLLSFFSAKMHIFDEKVEFSLYMWYIMWYISLYFPILSLYFPILPYKFIHFN